MGGLLARRTFDAVDDVSFALEAGRPEIFTDHRRVRQRQDHARPHDPQHGAADRRARSASAAPTSRPSAARRERLAFMRQVQPIFQNPFEAFNPLKRVDRYLFMTARRFADARSTREVEAAGRRGAAQGRAVARRGEGPLSARAVRRAAAAHRDRARADLGAGADRRRRAGLDGRRLAAHVDRQPVQDAARRPRGLDHLHHPRPRDRLLHQRPPDDHAEGPRGRERRRARGARRPAAPLFDPAQELRALAG